MGCYWGFIVGDGCLVLLRGRLVEIVLYWGWNGGKCLWGSGLSLSFERDGDPCFVGGWYLPVERWGLSALCGIW